MAIFGWRGYFTHCFLALLLQQHRLLTDFMMYSHCVPRKQLQEPHEVRITALNKIYDLNLMIRVMNHLLIMLKQETQVPIMGLDSLQEVMFRSTSGAIVANRCQEREKNSFNKSSSCVFFLFSFSWLRDLSSSRKSKVIEPEGTRWHWSSSFSKFTDILLLNHFRLKSNEYLIYTLFLMWDFYH